MRKLVACGAATDCLTRPRRNILLAFPEVHWDPLRESMEEERTLDLQEGRQQLKLVFLGGYGVCELLAIVEWLEQSFEAVVHQRHLVGHLRGHMEGG
jgi:hypothetical protein